jgi:GIY-YIG catalytic domain
MEWKNWSSVVFTERHRLPTNAGIYVVADASDWVWYIGQAVNLKSRWAGKSHHRYAQLVRSFKKRGYRIYWKEFALDSLTEQEKYYIDLFKPELNGCKIKKYLPQQPQVEREIKRLLTIINQPTFLFPTIRSVVAGEYEGENGTHCIIVLINSNDYQIIYNSKNKKRPPRIKNAWNQQQFYCGRSEHQYRSVSVPVYNFYNYKFEFIELPNFIFYLEANFSECERYIRTVELFGVQVKALKYLDILREMPVEAEYFYVDSTGKKHLKDLDYLNYRVRKIRCLK